MNQAKIMGEAARMAARAKSGTVRINGKTYTLQFNSASWLYVVSDSEDAQVVVQFNTKNLATAKKLLRAYLAD